MQRSARGNNDVTYLCSCVISAVFPRYDGTNGHNNVNLGRMAEAKHRTTLYLDKHLMKDVKIWAVEEGRSVSQIVERLLTEYLLAKKAGFDDADEDTGDGSQTIADVESIFGTPTSKQAFADKVIYKYQDMTVEFVNGKVSDIKFSSADI